MNGDVHNPAPDWLLTTANHPSTAKAAKERRGNSQ